MKLRPLAMALSGGIVWGAVVLFATWWLVLSKASGQTMALLGKFYLGYKVSFLGGVIGFAWGFVDGFLIALFFALLYNLFAKPKAEAA